MLQLVRGCLVVLYYLAETKIGCAKDLSKKRDVTIVDLCYSCFVSDTMKEKEFNYSLFMLFLFRFRHHEGKGIQLCG